MLQLRVDLQIKKLWKTLAVADMRLSLGRRTNVLLVGERVFGYHYEFTTGNEQLPLKKIEPTTTTSSCFSLGDSHEFLPRFGFSVSDKAIYFAVVSFLSAKLDPTCEARGRYFR